MTHQEKETTVSLVSSLISTVPYLIYIIGRYQSENLNSAEQLVFWASALLLIIPVRIAVEIVVSIIFGIFTGIVHRKQTKDMKDERDRLISLYSSRVRDGVFSTGIIIAMITAANGQGPAVMIVIMIIFGMLAEVSEYIAQLYMYRKGV